MAEARHIVLDATAARMPESGVQYAVRREAEELQKLLPEAHCCRAGWLTRHPLCRIAWQQTVLPWHHCQALYAMAYTAPFLCKAPYLLNVHDVIALTHPALCSCKNALQMQMLLPWSIRHARHIVVSTCFVADEIRRLFACKNITVAPLGVDFEYFAQGGEQALPPQVRQPYFFFVGNLEPKKGLDTLLNAFVQGDFSKHQLVIAGQAAWKSQGLLEAIRRFPEKIVWLGRVEAAQLPVLYRRAEAFVFPSVVEGFGLPMLEAMAAGTPVLYSEIPALCEVAGNAGRYFPSGDSQALTAHMRQLASSSSLRQDLSEAGRERARAFSWKKRASITADLLIEI